MDLLKKKNARSSKKTTLLLLFVQTVIFAAIILSTRTPLLWIWATLSFVPAVIMCFRGTKNSLVVSLTILFVSQQAIFFLANPNWGLGFGSDAINDFQTASVMSESSHFDLGNLGYSNRLSYSYYPMMHLFSVILAGLGGFSLSYVALYFMPILNAVITAFSLYQLNHELFGLDGVQRNLATLLFEIGFVYTSFDAQFVREAFAFPIILLTLWVLIRAAKQHFKAFSVAAVLLIPVIVLSHQISSYVFFIILTVLALSFNLFYHNSRLNKMLLLSGVLLGAYTVFVALSFSASTWTYVIEGIQAIMSRQAAPSILKTSSTSAMYLSLFYYMLLGVCAVVGGLRLIRNKKKDWVSISVVTFFTIAFVLSMILRLSTSADPWSYTYYMALRGTIWAFIGISVIAAVGLIMLTKVFRSSLKVVAVVLIVCVLAIGKFSQFPAFVTDSSPLPVTHSRYVASLWIRANSVHGDNMLVAPYQLDNDAFEASRDMAPYAYLKEYFVDESKGYGFNEFSGYVPFVGGFFEQYRNSTRLHIVYSNGDVQVGGTN